MSLGSPRPTQFTPSPNWRKPNITLSLDERVQKANAALLQTLNATNITNVGVLPRFGDPGTFVNQLVLFDSLTNQTLYNDTVMDILQTVNKQRPGFITGALDFTMQYGEAAAHAYQVYGNPVFLQLAESTWAFVNEYTLTPSQVASGRTSAKNITIPSECNSASLVGATFWQADFNTSLINILSCGNNLVLSSLLAEITSNSTYTQAASASFDFIYSLLYSSANVIVLDGIDVRSCGVDAGDVWIQNQALFLEGTTLLGMVTKNETLQNLAMQLIQSSVTNSEWQNSYGVLNDQTEQPHTSGAGHGRLARALSISLLLNSGDPALQEFIKMFIGVQYNAVTELAASEQGYYASSWHGPPPTSFDYDSQISATDVLLGGIAASKATPIIQARKIPVAAIAASAVVGGILLILTLVFLFLLYRRRQLRELAALNAARSPLYIEAFPSTTTLQSVADRERGTSLKGALPPLPRDIKGGRNNPLPALPLGNLRNRDASSNSPSSLNRLALPSVEAPSNGLISESLEGRARAATNVSLTIGELVGMLNEQLRQGNAVWDEEEQPPVYGQSE